MLAARVHDFDSDPVVEELPEPEAGPGESVVAVEAAPLGHMDLTVLTGRFVMRPPLPYVPGTDGAGVVVSSARLPEGARVRVRGAGVGLSRDGTWRGLAVVPDDALHPLPDGADPTLAASFFSPATTAHVAVHELGGLEAGERVAVTGASGAVGSLAVQFALRGGGEVFALVGRAEKAASVPDGATVVVPGEEPPSELDLLVDTVGGPRLPGLVPHVRPGGRAVLVGYTAGTAVTFELPLLLASGVRLLPLTMLEWGPRVMQLAPGLLALLQAGELRLPLEVRPLREVAAAIADLRAARVVGRVVLTP